MGEQTIVKELPELKLVGFRVLCSGEQYIEEIPKASILLKKRQEEIKHIATPSIQVGAFVPGDCQADQDGYWVCMEVREFESVPEDMVTLVIPSQKYAVISYKGPNTGILDAYEVLHNRISKSGYKRLLDKWHLEKFHLTGSRRTIEEIKEVDAELLDTVE
ncbi:GyrI-like domain-containing protein [Bacillus marinisedimentorum]|uniref:GyrI-like domain-containing protein n=1 Tax=Bacillus marinisedimentorum TaxID=1821260 RepID=UPI000872BB31|nr:GyrI-like domain-containing protein [Bacillus marinisedimentorum]